jgi:hypothetical protein
VQKTEKPGHVLLHKELNPKPLWKIHNGFGLQKMAI